RQLHGDVHARRAGDGRARDDGPVALAQRRRGLRRLPGHRSRHRAHQADPGVQSMIQGYTPPSGPGNAAFPAPPKGDPGGIIGASRLLSRAAEALEHAEGGLHGANAELEADWQGYAAKAYHSSSNALAQIARGASETFRDCAQAVS